MKTFLILIRKPDVRATIPSAKEMRQSLTQTCPVFDTDGFAEIRKMKCCSNLSEWHSRN